MIDDLISVIIPVYNVEKYLKECLDSVINQTHKNIEIILIDDGSTDNSGKICDEYRKKDDRIIVIHKSNEGLSSARNDGLIHAKGKYIQFIDSDDYVNRDMLEITYSIIKKYNADVVTFSHYILNDGKAICDCSKEEKVLNKMEAMKELLLDNKIRNYSWEKLWKKELFQDIKFPEGKKFEDIATTPFLFEKANKIILYDYPQYYYRQRQGSILHIPSEELSISYIDTTIMINEYMQKYTQLEQYCNYSIVAATIRVYNDIALYNLESLYNNNKTEQLYNILKNIMKDKYNEKMIVENMNTTFKMHLYYLLKDKEKYIKNNKYLPKLCVEHNE